MVQQQPFPLSVVLPEGPVLSPCQREIWSVSPDPNGDSTDGGGRCILWTVESIDTRVICDVGLCSARSSVHERSLNAH